MEGHAELVALTQTPASLFSGRRPAERSPDFRYRIAVHLQRIGRVAAAHEADPPTQRLVRYLHDEAACDTAAQRRRLALRERCLAHALLLGRRSQSPLAAAMESLLLARCGSARIASALQLRTEAVEDYRTYFFDVQRLHNRRYLIDWIIARELQRGDDKSVERRIAAKLVAYLAGPDLLFAGPGDDGPVHQLRSVVEYQTLQSDLNAIVRQWLSPQSWGASAERRADFIEKFLKRWEASPWGRQARRRDSQFLGISIGT